MRNWVAIMLALVPLAAHAAGPMEISDGVVRIGILTDMSGPYSAMGGAGSVVAAQLAVDECLIDECRGLKIEILQADHQNKADLGAAKAREWLEQGKVDAIADLTNSAVALAVQQLMRDQGGIALHSGPATARLTNEDCAANGFHWMFDTYSQSVGGAAALTKLGFKNWYFLTVDYAFGHSLEKDAADMVRYYDGTVLGAVRHPLNTADFSSFLLQAKAAKPQVIALANGGQDAVNAIRQAKELGIDGKNARLAALLVFLTDVHALGLEAAQGLVYADGFYWDADEDSREFASRFEAKLPGLKPTMVQGGVYSSVLHYLRSVAAARTDQWQAVVKKMRQLPISDGVMHNAYIRADGRVAHDMYLFEVKAPEDQRYPWDYLTQVGTIPAAEAFQSLAKSSCPLVKN